MHLLFVIARWRPLIGGTERQAELLADELGRRGHRVTVLTQSCAGTPARESSGGVEVVRLPPGVGGRAASALFGLRVARFAARQGRECDAFQAFLASAPALFLAHAARRAGRPVLLKLGASGPMGDVATSRRTLVGRAKLRLLRRWCDRCLCPNEEIRRELLAVGFAADRLVLLPNGVPTDRIRPLPPEERERLRRELAWERRTVALFAGRLEPQKDPLGLVRAWAAAAAGRPGALLAVAGGGSLREPAAALAERLGIAGSVRLLGPRDAEEVRRLMAAADLFVLPSRAEGISNALLEAMASGLAVLASDIPGNRDLVRDGENGRLFAPERPERAAELLARLVDSPAERAALAARARRDAEERHSLAGTADRYLAALEDLRRGAPAGAGRRP